MSNQEKNITLPKQFFLQTMVLLYSLEKNGIASNLDKLGKDAIQCLYSEIDAKFERMNRRNSFTGYKTAPTPEEREIKRREYLQQAGIHPDWISDKEINL